MVFFQNPPQEIIKRTKKWHITWNGVVFSDAVLKFSIWNKTMELLFKKTKYILRKTPSYSDCKLQV